MYRLAIVEDEESIRNSLAKYIPWQQLGFEVAGVFSDSMQAMRFIRENGCDAVLTDIMMNTMSGLELARILCESFPEIKIVVLSGYSKFEYAQEAIRYRVSAYLLKPVDEDELMREFQKLKEELDKEQLQSLPPEKDTLQEQNADTRGECSDMEHMVLIIEMDLGEQEVLKRLIERIFCELRDNTVSEIRSFVTDMLSSIDAEYQKRKFDIWELAGEEWKLDALQDMESAEQMKVFMQDCLLTVSAEIQRAVPQNEDGIVGRIKDYLTEHMGEEIAHDTMAAKFRIHPGYMSRLFRQTTGETVSGYLFRKRMERAVLLLQNEKYMISEVAEMVGYSNPSYFSFMVKKYTGHSPKELQQRVLP